MTSVYCFTKVFLIKEQNNTKKLNPTAKACKQYNQHTTKQHLGKEILLTSQTRISKLPSNQSEIVLF